ncbi:RagB/SusD family nutrient uptake outer membrane protein [Chitinophaga solisilvae]|uniref:RagB/SusD family nutrient uptake outer membrane protein n=1 Tax=Chitinophaga solisilvae TaxID=1233460 RepID=UPI00136FF638|nr:RagB/SusD family nutrient uptake outer membrane protein [Chitinophaga solisilvae]
MKKRLLYISLISAAMAGSSCNKFLDVVPKGKDTPRTLEHYNGLLNSTALVNYADVVQAENGSTTTKGTAVVSVMMGDDLITDPLFLQVMGPSVANAYTWQADIFRPEDDVAEWGAFYGQNYVYNLIANNVMAVAGNEEKKRQVRAEARAARALMHFMLVNYFGKPYNAATAAGDPGIPVVKEANANGTIPPRSSVQEVYDFIISELQAAIPDLPEITPMRLRMGQAAGYYLLGQTYLTMGRYEAALKALESCRAAVAKSHVPVRLYDYNQMMPQWTSPALPQYGVFGHPTQFDNEENIYLKQINILDFVFGNVAMLSPAAEEKFDPADLRLKFFYNKDYLTGSMTLPYKLRNSPIAINIGAGLPGLYLMLAECEARTGNLAAAAADLLTLRKSRMPADKAVVSATTREEMIRFVIDERIRELACTGQRWFDMRRLSNDPIFKDITYTHTLGSKTWTLSPERLTLRIPAKILQQNPGMPDNP